jgi:hypothetical protein
LKSFTCWSLLEEFPALKWLGYFPLPASQAFAPLARLAGFEVRRRPRRNRRGFTPHLVFSDDRHGGLVKILDLLRDRKSNRGLQTMRSTQA